MRSLVQLHDDVRLKGDEEIRRSMTSGNAEDRGGFRHPGYDVYLVVPLCNFGHTSNYVHVPCTPSACVLFARCFKRSMFTARVRHITNLR